MLSRFPRIFREGVRVLFNGDDGRSLERSTWRWKMKMLKNEDAVATFCTACIIDPFELLFGWMLGDRLSNILMEGK